MNIRKTLTAALPALGLLLVTAPSLRAQVSVPLFFTNSYRQTGPATTTYIGSSFSARILETNPGDVAAATLTYPGAGSPGTYTATAPTVLSYGVNEPTPAALQTAFPFGTYTTDYSGGTAGSGSVSINYTQNAFGNDFPSFTPATYTGLQGLNPGQAFTISTNAFDTGATANSSFVFFNIYNPTTGAVVYSQNFQPAGTTSFTLPGGTLQPNTTYNTDLNFSNRISSTDVNGVDTTLGFDQRTGSSFTTGPVPEASTVVSLGLLLMLGLGGMRLASRKKSVKA